MITANMTTNQVFIGGYKHNVEMEMAGPYGCSPCFRCGVTPKYGAPVWTTHYGDVFCNRCVTNES